MPYLKATLQPLQMISSKPNPPSFKVVILNNTSFHERSLHHVILSYCRLLVQRLITTHLALVLVRVRLQGVKSSVDTIMVNAVDLST